MNIFLFLFLFLFSFSFSFSFLLSSIISSSLTIIDCLDEGEEKEDTRVDGARESEGDDEVDNSDKDKEVNAEDEDDDNEGKNGDEEEAKRICNTLNNADLIDRKAFRNPL